MDVRLAAYLERIRLAAPPVADLPGLEAIQRAHRLAIPFENLDIRLGRSIAIDGDSVFEKLITGHRGGYCFEHNRLLADMLALLGMQTRPLLARVRLGLPADTHPPRTHVLLFADFPEGAWIADVGFGGSYLPPMPLADGAEATTPDGARHRLRRSGQPGSLAGEWLLERAGPRSATDGRGLPHEEWQPQYSFDLAEVAQADLEQANHWTATAPGSRFTNLHIVTLALPEGFASLTDRSLSISSSGQCQTRELGDRDSYGDTLREVFGIDLPDGDLARLPLF